MVKFIKYDLAEGEYANQSPVGCAHAYCRLLLSSQGITLPRLRDSVDLTFPFDSSKLAIIKVT